MTGAHTEEIPDWVPNAVITVAGRIEIGKKFGERLIYDARMKNVWPYLKRRAKVVDVSYMAPWFFPDGSGASFPIEGSKLADRLAELPSLHRMETWGVDTFGVPLPDQACASFYCAVVLALGVPREPVTMCAIEAITKPMHDAAEQCRLAINHPCSPAIDRDRASSLATAAAHLEHLAAFIEGANRENPYVLPRRGNDDETRAKVRAIALSTHAIFGEFSYGTLATIAAVTMNAEISKKTIRNWCGDQGVSLSAELVGRVSLNKN